MGEGVVSVTNLDSSVLDNGISISDALWHI